MEKSSKECGPSPVPKRTTNSGTAFRQILISLLANITALASGMTMAFPAISLMELTNKENSVYLTPSQGTWFASINTIACPLGGFLASVILDKFGRKNTLIINNLIYIIGWLLSVLADQDSTDLMYTELLISRFILGIGAGLSSSPIAVYSAEIAHPSLRGKLIMFTSTSIAIGVLLIYFFGYLIQTNWRMVSAAAGVISVIALIITTFLPESPHWLVRKNKLNRAEKSFNKLNGKGSNEIEAQEKRLEFEHLLEVCKKPDKLENERKENLWTKLKRPEVYKPLGIINAFFTFQQLAGTFAIVVYVGMFSKSVGVTIEPFLFIVLGGVCRVLGTFTAAFLADKLGRRKSSFISGIGIAVTMFGIAICMLYPSEWSNSVVGILIQTYIYLNTIGFLSVPFALVAELYPQNVRGFAAGISVCYVYFIAFGVIKCFPFFLNLVGTEVMCLFIGAIGLFGSLFVYIFLPESNGKTFKEIEAMFRNN